MVDLRDDPNLLRAFRDGERSALERVYWEYVDVVATVIRRGVSLSEGRHVAGIWTDEASELVQETFVRAFDKRARLAYDGLREYRPYLLTICRNLLVDYVRKQGREIPMDFDIGSEETFLQDSEGSNAESWSNPATIEAVQNYVNILSAPLRNVYQQRYVLGVSQEQAAHALGTTRQRVRTLEMKLRKGLAQHLHRLERRKP